jgi:hypothetical protein
MENSGKRRDAKAIDRRRIVEQNWPGAKNPWWHIPLLELMR